MIPVYVIHCSELKDRTEKCFQHLFSRGIGNAVWVRSIYGKAWGIETTREYDEGKRISPGHVGLLIGHWIAWQVAAAKAAVVAADNNTPALILEDDVILPEDWQQQLDEVEAKLADCFPDWELCMVGHCESEPQVWHKVTERVGGPSSRICRINLPFGTHAYLVRPSAIPKLLDLLPQGGAVRNMDQQLFFNALQGNQIKWCAVLPALIRQRTFDYTRQGNPEWGPSTIDPNDEKEAAFGYQVTETEARSIVGNAEPPPRITPEALAATLKMVDPLPCIYRGETLDSHGLAEKKRTVTVSQCARLGVPCHNKPEKQVGKVRTADGDPVRVCESCELRTSMNPGGAKRTRLPLPEGHFNPSMHMWLGRLVLATRDSWGHSRVALWYLDNSRPDWTGEWKVSQIGSYAAGHPEAPRLEDPRLFVAPDPDTGRDRLHCMFNLPDGYPPKRVQVGYVRFDGNLTGIEHCQVYRSPQRNAYEKNWAPFYDRHEGDLRWVYGGKPQHIVLGRQAWTTDNHLPWSGGVWRGGASPVLIERDSGQNEYYHFFHGCLKRFSGNVYTVGCAVFEATPPFRILRQTPNPIIWPELQGTDEEVVKSHVVWPGGAVLHARHWHLALGIDDSFCQIQRLSYDAVEAAMTNVPETETSVSMRESQLAMGTGDR